MEWDRSIMDVDKNLELWLADDVPQELLETPLSEAIAQEVVERLKREADRHWFISPNRSLEFATRIVSIGQARADVRQIALGLMATGDTLKFLGRLEEAWERLEQAGRMFESVEDQVGWARTRIGLLYLGLKLDRVETALADAGRARTIFLNHGEQEKLIRLEINTAYVHTQRGDQQRALDLYHSALQTAEALGEAGQPHLGLLHMNIGFAYGALGDLPKALAGYEKARQLFTARDETRNIANVELNIAYIAQAQGRYREALRILYGILSRDTGQFPLEERAIKKDLIECYLCLNRYPDARDLAGQVVAEYRKTNARYDTALTLLHLATAEAGLHDFAAAQRALDEAGTIFESLGAYSWSMIARLRHGQIMLRQGNLEEASEDALTVSAYFRSAGQRGQEAAASLLLGQVSLQTGDLAAAAAAGAHALETAQRQNMPSLRYAAFLLLGRVAEARSSSRRAIRCYQAAAATIERVQRGLTITLRSGFLEDKVEAGRELVNLYLRLGKTRCALEALEWVKSQVLLGYLEDRDQFRWVHEDPESRALIEELDALRAEHQWFYRLAHEASMDPQRQPASVRPDYALEQVGTRERRMRAITEQLYLRSRDVPGTGAAMRSILPIQELLDESTVLIEYYNDGDRLWAFILDRETIDVHPLPVAVGVLHPLIRQLQMNLASAVRIHSPAVTASSMTHLGQRILQRLYSLLIEPLDLPSRTFRRLVIVPYGALHYLPFNLLYDGSSYLIERFEIVTLPTASLLTRPAPRRMPGALVLSNSWSGRLPQTGAEGRLVHQLFGGALFTEEAACRQVLQRPPGQILHIAAHGRHRLDLPDLSYIELADGQLYADDLLQQDLSYELVTLSACETGRANVAADEELIGIGRGLLYAGAGALILSLWPVADSSTIELMEQLYRALQAGRSKASALRQAQMSFLARDRQIHPAFWGSFQLIGDAGPLTSVH